MIITHISSLQLLPSPHTPFPLKFVASFTFIIIVTNTNE